MKQKQHTIMNIINVWIKSYLCICVRKNKHVKKKILLSKNNKTTW